MNKQSSMLNKFFGKTQRDNAEIIIQKCIYCKRDVRTCAEVPKCSRKSCKKQYPRTSHSGMQSNIKYDEKLIEVELTQ